MTPTQSDSYAGTDVDPTGAMFASRSVPVHLVRGVLGLVLLVAGLVLSATSPWWLVLLVATVVLWRGCPTCWAMGLISTRAQCSAPRR